MDNFTQRLQSMGQEKSKYILQTLPYHLKSLGDTTRLKIILMDYYFIQNKIEQIGIRSLQEDYLDVNEPDLELIGRTIQLSSHTIYDDAFQLPSQLVGRLLDTSTNGIKKFLNQINPKRTWLRPLTSGLISPQHPLVKTIPYHGKKIIDILPIAGTDLIVCRFMDLAVKIINKTDPSEIYILSTGVNEITLIGAPWPVSTLALTPDRNKVVYSYGNNIKVWDIARQTHIREFSGHQDSVTGIVITPDGKRLISCSWDKTIRLWNFEEGKEEKILEDSAFVSSICISKNGDTLFTGSWSGEIKVWDIELHKCTKTMQTDEKSNELYRLRTTLSFTQGTYTTNLKDEFNNSEHSIRITDLKYITSGASQSERKLSNAESKLMIGMPLTI